MFFTPGYSGLSSPVFKNLSQWGLEIIQNHFPSKFGHFSLKTWKNPKKSGFFQNLLEKIHFNPSRLIRIFSNGLIHPSNPDLSIRDKSIFFAGKWPKTFENSIGIPYDALFWSFVCKNMNLFFKRTISFPALKISILLMALS